MSDQLILMKGAELKALVFDAVTEALTMQKQHVQEHLNPYMTCKDAAVYLGKTPNAVRQLVSKEQIKYLKKDSLLYFRTEDLVEYLEGKDKDSTKDDCVIKMKGAKAI